MKKFLIAFTFSVLMSKQIAAIGIGLFGGFNISDVADLGGFTGVSETTDGVTVTVDSLDSNTTLRSFMIGAYLESGLGIPLLAMRYEAVYVKKGMELRMKGNTFAGGAVFDTSINSKFELTYLDIPVLLQISKSFFGFRPFLLAGPVFSIFLSDKGTVTVNIREVGIESTEVEPEGFSSSVYVSLLVGGGLAYKLSPLNEIFVSFRYLWGQADQITTIGGSQQFREINILFGLGFKI